MNQELEQEILKIRSRYYALGQAALLWQLTLWTLALIIKRIPDFPMWVGALSGSLHGLLIVITISATRYYCRHE